MIVADASAVVELLLNTDTGARVGRRLLDPTETVCAPHLLDVEVLQVLRRYGLAGELTGERDQQARDDFADLPVQRYPHGPLHDRIWELRHNLTAYDAAYVALTEALEAPLLTCDGRLAEAPVDGVRIELA